MNQFKQILNRIYMSAICLLAVGILIAGGFFLWAAVVHLHDRALLKTEYVHVLPPMELRPQVHPSVYRKEVTEVTTAELKLLKERLLWDDRLQHRNCIMGMHNDYRSDDCYDKNYEWSKKTEAFLERAWGDRYSIAKPFWRADHIGPLVFVLGLLVLLILAKKWAVWLATGKRDPGWI